MARSADAEAHAGIAALVAEFVPLNRRRLHGSPPLGVEELERWMYLRDRLAHPEGKPADARSRALRVPTHLKVRYQGDGAGVSTSNNISEGGLFIASSEPLQEGTPLRLEIDAGAGMGPVQVDATVAWRRTSPSDAGPAGFGVQFVDVEPDQHAAIGEIISQALERMAEDEGA